jgi:hypothetical protein
MPATVGGEKTAYYRNFPDHAPVSLDENIFQMVVSASIPLIKLQFWRW